MAAGTASDINLDDPALGGVPLNVLRGFAAPAASPAAPSASPSIPTVADIGRTAKQLKALQDPQAEARMKQAYQQEQQAVQGLKSVPPPPAPPELTPLPPQPDTRLVDPIQALGSPMAMLSVLGSLLTRAPLTAALNAGAAAMQSFHKGNMEAANFYEKQWKDHLDEVIKQNGMQTQRYKEILDQQQASVNQKLAELQAAASSFRDANVLAAAESGSIDQAEKLIQAQVTAQEKFIQEQQLAEFRKAELAQHGQTAEWAHEDRVAAEEARTQAAKDSAELKKLQMQATQENQKENRELKAKIAETTDKLRMDIAKMNDVTRQASIRARTMTAQAKTKASADMNDHLIKMTDKLIKEVTDNPEIVGARGTFITHPLETVKGVLHPGEEMKTPYAVFRSDISDLRQQLSVAITGSKYYSGTRALEMGKILPGLEGLTSPQQVINSLKNIKFQLEGAKTENPLLPEGIPDGSTLIGTHNGNPVYQDPKGARYEVTKQAAPAGEPE